MYAVGNLYFIVTYLVFDVTENVYIDCAVKLSVYAYDANGNLKGIKGIKASPRNPRMAHLLASFPSYFTKILASSAATACEFLYCLTKNPTAQLHHRNYAVMP